jgi:predicted transcriptional regulator
MTEKKNIIKKVSNEIAENIRSIIGDETNIRVGLERKKIPAPEFVMLYQAVGMLYLKELSEKTIKVFYLFLLKLKYGNHIGMNVDSIAEETKISIASVERALKQLKENKMIISYSDPQDKRRNIYILNPHIAWKGTVSQRKKVMREMDKNQLSLDLPFAPNLTDTGVIVITKKMDWCKDADKFIATNGINKVNPNKTINTNETGQEV